MIHVGLKGSNNEGQIDSHIRDDNTGLLVYTEPHIVGTLSGVPFFNPIYGADLNQNVSFTGTPELINNGGDTVGWTGSIGAGTWSFTDATDPDTGLAHVSVTNADDLDFAIFSDATETNMANYTAITGRVNLVSYNGALDDIKIQMYNDGSPVGIQVSLNSYITTSLLGSYQSFVIPKADLELNGFTIDEMRIIINRTAGGKPTIYFDNIQIEETGDPLVFEVQAAAGEAFHITEIIVTIADTGTGGAAYAYNKIGAVTALANGVNFNAVVDDETLFGSTIRQNSDLLNAGGRVTNIIDDGVNTFYTISIDASSAAPVILDSRNDDYLNFVINDDLSGLDVFTAVALGFKETIADR
jgi:hypothetical protein